MSPFGIEPETPVERAIVEDPEWVEGAGAQGTMSGHPEDLVAEHVLEVLRNVDGFFADSPERARLRIVALVHDTFKHEVRWWWPGRTDHAQLARRFAERHVDDEGLLRVVELHDEGYRAWRHGRRTGRWEDAAERAQQLVERLGDALPLFRAFYRCDNETGSKSPDDRLWFEDVCTRMGR